MGRGLYHQTGIGRNDMVLHQDHRGRWRIDLVTSASGAHTDVTGRESGAGPNQGYSTAELAFAGALDEQRRRGLRGKTHVWIQKDDGYESYEPEGDHLPNVSPHRLQRIKTCANCGHHKSVHRYDPSKPGSGPQHCDVPRCRCAVFRQPAEGERVTRHESNGRRTGILSDGTRVNVYHKPGTLDEYTVVPHGIEWDRAARGDMREMLGLSATGAGFSEWTTGQEGRHLGRKLAWEEVPDVLKRHIERRVSQDSTMVANARKKKPKAETREERINRQWDEAEEAGLVKLDSDAEYENYFDVYGEPDDPEERDELIRQIDRQGLWHVASFYLDQTTGNWAQADSIGMMFGDSAADPNDPYILDLKQAALENIYGGHERNPRGSTVDEHAKRELELYIENEYALIGDSKSMGKAIDANLRKKVAKGTYDPGRAPQAWQHLIDEGARRYAKAFSSSERDATQIFSAATRRAVAAEFARAWEAENLR